MFVADLFVAEEAMFRLQCYKKVGQRKWNGRCPVCGDSMTDAHKARFWIYEYKGELRAGCFNCNYNRPMGAYLKEYEPDLYRKWLLERRRESGHSMPVDVPTKCQSKMPVIAHLDYSERLDRLPDNHPIITYVKNRMIPECKYNRLWFTMDWRKLVNSVNPGTYHNEAREPRLVIPLFNENKEIQAFQGRALRNDPNKYITIKAHSDVSKVYGLDTIDPSLPVYMMEGPIDSLFINNAGAITGGQMSLDEVPYANKRVWVLDNEPHHPDTCKRLSKLIAAGERVVMWDRAPWHSKDVNDMIVKESATAEQIEQYFKENTVQGLTAKLRFSKWKRV